MNKINIGIITSSRADYDLLRPIIIKLKKKKFFKTSIIVTGSHFLKKFGYTYKKIKKDNFKISERVNIFKNNYNEASISTYIGKGINEFVKILEKKKYKFLIVLGDRYELLSFVIPALFFKVPIIHISGGESTEGSIDDYTRHIITKCSQYHFVSNNVFKKRVVQLGEHPDRVFVVGSTGIENIKKQKKYLKKESLSKLLNFEFQKENFLITYHPVTNQKDYGISDFKELLKALSFYKNAGIIFTSPNADTKNNIFFKLIKNFVSKNPNSKYLESLGGVKYFSTILQCNAVIGNSSSGIIEVPSLRRPSINLGIRQKGRLFSKSIVNCEKVTMKRVLKAIKKALSKNFVKQLSKIKNPYEKNNASDSIVNLLIKISKNQTTEKRFYDFNI